MRNKAHGQIRRSQVITTFGPGSLIDLPKDSAIIGGLETWPSSLEEVIEPRLTRKLQSITGVRAPKLFAPPFDDEDPRVASRGICAWRFPEWFVVQEDSYSEDRKQSRRLVHRLSLDERGKFDGHSVVATRFVRACPKGHVDDINWYKFVHGPEDNCRRQLWLDERGTSGDLGDLVVRCECRKSRSLSDATEIEVNPLGTCKGARPWLGRNANEECHLPSRLLIRTASNAYFPMVVSVLSLPDRGSALETVVRNLWDDLQIVDSAEALVFIRRKPRITEQLASFNDGDVLKAIEEFRSGRIEDKPVKHVELDAILAVPVGFGDDVPIDPDFHARRLPDRAWRNRKCFTGVASVFQIHRLREVQCLVGFTRLEAVTPDINGEFETDVERASIAIEPKWFPAIENRGEGVFILIDSRALKEWLSKPPVQQRLLALETGHKKWILDHRSDRLFPGGPYIMLHTLSHLLIQSLAMHCGYPASSIRERIYTDPDSERFGILLYTGSSDAEGTLGGLVQQGRHIEQHLLHALRNGSLCSNDPVCSQHEPGKSLEGRYLHGSACHGCALIAETSCEMRNDYLDRALVIPVLGCSEAAFFRIEE